MEESRKTDRVQGFEELRCDQLALKLLDSAYKLAKELPDYEKYNLASQIRRSALSTVLNIAEGYGRYHYLDKLRFFYIARGSLSETRSAFIAAHTIGYIDEEQRNWALTTESETQKSLNGYIDYIRRQQQGKKEFGPTVLKEDHAEYILLPDSLIPDSPSPESPIPDSPSPDSLIPDSPSPDSQSPDSPSPDSQIPDSQSPDSQSPDSQTPDSQSPDSQSPDSPIPDSLIPDSLIPDSQTPDSQSPSLIGECHHDR